MSHNYFFEIINFINNQLENAQEKLRINSSDDLSKQLIAGRIEALCETERFINDNFIDKLPRRLRAKLKTNSRCVYINSGPQIPDDRQP